MSQYAANRIAAILDTIQALHAEARELSNEYNIPFDITLDGGNNLDTYHEYEPSYGWSSSALNC